MSSPAYRQVRRQLREARSKAKLLRAEVQVKQLERARSLLESWNHIDWPGVSWGMQSAWNERRSLPGLIATASDRRHGRNFPLFQTESELAILRMRSRIQAQTNAYAIGLVDGLVGYVIGGGYTYEAVARKRSEGKVSPQVIEALCDAVNEAVEDFDEANEWFGGEQPGMEEELFVRSLEDGEFIVRHWAVGDDDGDTTIRTVEPEQMTQPPGSSTEEAFGGVITPKDDAQRIKGYYIFDGDNSADGDEYSPEDVTHFRRNVKRSIKRGCPDFSWDVYDALDSAAKLRHNMVEGGAVQAAIVGIRQHESATSEEVTEMKELLADYHVTNPYTGVSESVSVERPGTWLDINKGQNYLPPPMAANAQAYELLLQASLRAGGRRWNAPEWLVSGLHDTSSFASSLTAESPFIRSVLRNQRGYKTCFTRIKLVAVKNRCEAGRLIAAGKAWSWKEVNELIELRCSAPSPETRDKLTEAQRRQIELQAGTYSPQQWCADEGRDYDQTMTEIEEHSDRTGGAGLLLPTDTGGES